MNPKKITVGYEGVRPVVIGGTEQLVFIGGPCAIETWDHSFMMADRIGKICRQADIPWIFNLLRQGLPLLARQLSRSWAGGWLAGAGGCAARVWGPCDLGLLRFVLGRGDWRGVRSGAGSGLPVPPDLHPARGGRDRTSGASQEGAVHEPLEHEELGSQARIFRLQECSADGPWHVLRLQYAGQRLPCFPDHGGDGLSGLLRWDAFDPVADLDGQHLRWAA